jgi:hypothetical protein
LRELPEEEPTVPVAGRFDSAAGGCAAQQITGADGLRTPSARPGRLCGAIRRTSDSLVASTDRVYLLNMWLLRWLGKWVGPGVLFFGVFAYWYPTLRDAFQRSQEEERKKRDEREQAREQAEAVERFVDDVTSRKPRVSGLGLPRIQPKVLIVVDSSREAKRYVVNGPHSELEIATYPGPDVKALFYLHCKDVQIDTYYVVEKNGETSNRRYAPALQQQCNATIYEISDPSKTIVYDTTMEGGLPPKRSGTGKETRGDPVDFNAIIYIVSKTDHKSASHK